MTDSGRDVLVFKWAIESRLHECDPDYETRHCNRGCPFDPPCDPNAPQEMRCELSDGQIGISSRQPAYDNHLHQWHESLRKRNDPLYDIYMEGISREPLIHPTDIEPQTERNHHER